MPAQCNTDLALLNVDMLKLEVPPALRDVTLETWQGLTEELGKKQRCH